MLAVKLERQLPKTEILNRYLNAIYFGRGAYGVEAASKTYFGKDVGSLTLPEAAYLAGLIRSPETADAALPASDPGAASGLATAKFRRTSVLDNMVKQHYITQAQRNAAVASPWSDVLPKASGASTTTVTHTELGTQYVLDYVRHTLVASGQFNDAELYGGGLRIYTTIDYGLQRDALDAMTSTLAYQADPAASLVSIDPSGRIRAMAGSTDYASSQVNLAVGSQGGGGGRQAGSTFKTFAVAEALSQGMTLNRSYPAPYSLTVPNGNGQGDTWLVHNDNKGESFGRINMATALTNSINTYFAQLVTDINPQNLANMAKRMGVQSSLTPVPSLVLGTSGVSPLDMASGYSTLMDDGAHITPYIVSRVTDSSGQVLYQAPTTGTRVLSKNIADQMNWALSQVITQGTGKGADFGQPAAGKTGTTENNTDGWFTGYTCSLTASVWMGYPSSDSKPMSYLGVKNAYGGGYPATIWQKFMVKATQGLKSCPYNRPPNAAGSITDYGTGSSSPSSSVASGSTTTTGHLPSSTTTAPVAPTTVAPPTTVTPTTVPPTTAAPPTTIPLSGGGAPVGRLADQRARRSERSRSHRDSQMPKAPVGRLADQRARRSERSRSHRDSQMPKAPVGRLADQRARRSERRDVGAGAGLELLMGVVGAAHEAPALLAALLDLARGVPRFRGDVEAADEQHGFVVSPAALADPDHG